MGFGTQTNKFLVEKLRVIQKEKNNIKFDSSTHLNMSFRCRRKIKCVKFQLSMNA